MGSLLPSGDKSERGLCKMQASSILVVTTALLCFLALGSATADERVKKEAKMKTISSPSGGYNSITDKMLRFVMVKTSAQGMESSESYFYLTLEKKTTNGVKRTISHILQETFLLAYLTFSMELFWETALVQSFRLVYLSMRFTLIIMSTMAPNTLFSCSLMEHNWNAR